MATQRQSFLERVLKRVNWLALDVIADPGSYKCFALECQYDKNFLFYQSGSFRKLREEKTDFF